MSWAAIQATDSRSTSACSLASSLSASWAAVILALSAIVVSPFVALLEQTDDHEARDGRTHIGHAALLHHDPRLDRVPSPYSERCSSVKNAVHTTAPSDQRDMPQ